jgi:hypothetical protein
VTDSYHWDESLDEVEALIKSAGRYVGASEDLRPRVLEAARLQCGERRAQTCLRHLAVFVALLALFTAEFRAELDDGRSGFNRRVVHVAFEKLNPSGPTATTRSGDGDWRIIDAFTKLRRQQAQLLRLEI